MSIGWPSIRIESRAKGNVSGRASRIVIGSVKLSNCAASTMYMKTSERAKARMKLTATSSRLRERYPLRKS
jgi:hypothetical protein